MELEFYMAIARNGFVNQMKMKKKKGGGKGVRYKKRKNEYKREVIGNKSHVD